mmetsp:Transcript_95283/g.258639  ORF Transcript_95283/g.258639 Transcript_95283/m.258639 type:complete len:375 (-) Transcript_95283:223-1347(-)
MALPRARKLCTGASMGSGTGTQTWGVACVPSACGSTWGVVWASSASCSATRHVPRACARVCRATGAGECSGVSGHSCSASGAPSGPRDDDLAREVVGSLGRAPSDRERLLLQLDPASSAQSRSSAPSRSGGNCTPGPPLHPEAGASSTQSRSSTPCWSDGEVSSGLPPTPVAGASSAATAPAAARQAGAASDDEEAAAPPVPAEDAATAEGSQGSAEASESHSHSSSSSSASTSSASITRTELTSQFICNSRLMSSSSSPSSLSSHSTAAASSPMSIVSLTASFTPSPASEPDSIVDCAEVSCSDSEASWVALCLAFLFARCPAGGASPRARRSSSMSRLSASAGGGGASAGHWRRMRRVGARRAPVFACALLA